MLTKDQLKRSNKDKAKQIKKNKIPAFLLTQNLMATVTDLRESHDAFVNSVFGDLDSFGMVGEILGVHDAVHAMRNIADPEFTDRSWRPSLPGDQLSARLYENQKGDVADLTWPALPKQILPRDAEIMDIRTRALAIGFIHLFYRFV